MGSLSSITLGASKASKTARQAVDALTFVEAPWGLNMKLHPVQRVILKVYYGIALDDNPLGYPLDVPVPTNHVHYDPQMVDSDGYYKYRVVLWTWRREITGVVSEKEYLEKLHKEGRCNIGAVVPGKERRELILAVGRRSGKTELSSCIAAYETYRLLVKGDPQTYYGLPSSENIQLVSFATDKDQAGILYQKVSGYFRSCAFFAPYTANNTQTYAKFQTPKDIERYGSYQEDPNAKATIRVTFRSSVAKGARGPGNIVVVFDEMAHFTDNGQSSAEEVYNAVVPSTATFTPKDPKNKHKALSDNLESKILAISSPLGCQGMFYKLYQDGFRKELLDQRLCIQAPTWEVNTSIPAQIFQSEFIKDPRVFFTEFGAQFSDRTSGWLEDARDLMACVDPDARPRQKAVPLKPHFMGLDLALAGDASACVIGHVDELGRVVVDVAEAIQAGHGKFINQPRLEYSEVVNWIHELTKRFYIQAGAFDQWAGVIWGQLFKEKGLDRLEQVNSSALIRSQMYKNLKDVIYDKKLVLFDYPIEQGENHCQLITQLLELQAEYKSEYNIVVRAPKIAGKHDDLADALARMVQLATEQTGNKKTFATPYIAGSPRSGVAFRNAAPSISTHRKRLQTGSSPERMVPKRRGGIRGR